MSAHIAAAIVTSFLALGSATIDVRILTKEHPTELTLDGPRHVEVALIGGELGIDGVVAGRPYELPPGPWRVRIARRPVRVYRGSVTLAPAGRELSVVVHMDREEYVALAVASESEPGTPPAALEAQAIVSRSWAAAAARRHADADVCDLAHCQVLRGSIAPALRADARRATIATRGVVLTLASGAIATAPFHAACGGRTADPHEVFGGDDRTGAASVDDPGCDGPRWRAELPRETVERAAAEAFASSSGTSDRRRALRLADLETRGGAGGWVRAIVDTSTGATAFGDAFTRALGRAAGWNVIRGDRFQLSFDASGRVVVEGVGLGHGVGLCQRGAARRAAGGSTAAEILRHYFPRAALSSFPEEVVTARK